MPASRPSAPDGQVSIHSSSQGHFMVRAYTAKLLGINMSDIRVNPAEIGGGFGGKTLVYLEPVAVALSQKSGRTVKMQMTREDVFRGSGPTSGAVDGGQDRRQEGRHHRCGQAGAEVSRPARSPARRSGRAACAASRCTTCRMSMSSATTWSATARRSRPIVRRARRSRRSRVESAMDELALKLGIDPLTLREKNAARNGTKTHYGPTHQQYRLSRRCWTR